MPHHRRGDPDDRLPPSRDWTASCGSAVTPAPAKSWCCGSPDRWRRTPSSVVVPFLLPDTPVVAWWPGVAPAVPAQDPLGRLAIRRITDATNAPIRWRRSRAGWRATPPATPIWPGAGSPTGGRCSPRRWISRRYEQVTSALVSGLKTEPALDILAGWLASRIDGPVQRAVGELKVELVRQSETVTLSRPQDGRHRDPDPHRPARRPGSAAAPGNPRVSGRGLRRLDADEIYLEALAGIDKVQYAMSASVVEIFPDIAALVAAAGDRLVEAIASCHGGPRASADRADRRRHRHRAARALSAAARRDRLVEGAPVLG